MAFDPDAYLAGSDKAPAAFDPDAYLGIKDTAPAAPAKPQPTPAIQPNANEVVPGVPKADPSDIPEPLRKMREGAAILKNSQPTGPETFEQTLARTKRVADEISKAKLNDQARLDFLTTPDSAYTRTADFVKDSIKRLYYDGTAVTNAVKEGAVKLFERGHLTADYDGEGNLLNVRAETPEELSTRLKREDRIVHDSMHISDDNDVKVAAHVAGFTLDTMLPVGKMVQGAKAAMFASSMAKSVATIAAGGAYEASAEALRQRAHNGEVTDFSEVEKSGAYGALGMGVGVALGKAIGYAVRKYGESREAFEAAIKEFNDRIRANIDSGMNPEAAAYRARQELQWTSPTVQTVVHNPDGTKTLVSHGPITEQTDMFGPAPFEEQRPLPIKDTIKGQVSKDQPDMFPEQKAADLPKGQIEMDLGKPINERTGTQLSMDVEVPQQADLALVRHPKEYDYTQSTPIQKQVEQGIPDKTLEEMGTTLQKLNKGESWYKPGMDTMTSIGQKADNLIQIMRSQLAKVSPRLAHGLGMRDQQAKFDIYNYTERLQPFLAQFKKLPKASQELMRKATLNGDTELLGKLFSKHDGLEEVTDQAQAVFDEIADRAAQVDPEFQKMSKYYWFRAVSDPEKLKEGFKGADIYESHLEQAIKDHSVDGDITDHVGFADAVNKTLRFAGQSLDKRASAMYQRQIPVIPDNMLHAYEMPDKSALMYVNQMVESISTRQFFGRSGIQVEGEGFKPDIEKTVGNYIQKEVAAGNLKAQDANTIQRLLQARFLQGEKASPAAITAVKNVFYASTLGEFRAAITQLGDVGPISYMYGLKTALKSAVGPRYVDVVDIGAREVLHELEDTGATSQMVKKLFKWEGFAASDRMMKTVLMNAAYRTFRDAASGSDAQWAKVAGKYKAAFDPAEFDALRKEFASGLTARESGMEARNDISGNMRYVLWNELARLHPLSKSEFPVAYLEHPNGRFMYALNSFTLKQLQMIRDDGYSKIVKGSASEKAEGAKNLTRMMAYLTLAGASTQSIKQWLYKKDRNQMETGNYLERPSRQGFDDNIVSAFWRNYGLSDYMAKDLSKGDKISHVALDNLVPISQGVDSAYNALKDTYTALYKGENQGKMLKHVPIAGEWMYNFFGGGLEENVARMNKRDAQEAKQQRESDSGLDDIKAMKKELMR